MHLHDPANRHRADFHEGHVPEVLGIENADVTLIYKQDVILALQRLPLDSP